MRFRDGPAAVRGVARPPRRHWRAGRPDAGKAVGEGAPSQKTCRLLHTEPLVEGGFVARRLIVLVTVLGLALTLAATALGATVTVRVEGKTQPIFGSVPVKVQAPNALVALDAASTPIVTPTVSISTSYHAACRPRTKCWWNSSVTA